MSLEECVHLLSETLSESLLFFSHGETSDERGPPSQSDVVMALRSIAELRIANTPGQFVAVIDRAGIYEIVSSLAVEPLLYSPSRETGASLQQQFLNVRVAAMEAMGEIAAAHAAVKSVAPAHLAPMHLLEALLAQIAAPASLEAARLSSAQCLFNLCLVAPQELPVYFVQTLVQCAVLEPSPIVRSVILCIVREIARDVNLPSLRLEVGTFVKLLEVDESSDVRTLVAEILTIIMTPEIASEAPSEIVRSLRGCLSRISTHDSSPDEWAAVAILVTRLGVTSPLTVFPEVCTQRLDRVLLRAALHTHSFQLLACLRTVLDRCPAALRIGQQLLSDFASFSELFRLVLDASNDGGGVVVGAPSSQGADLRAVAIEAAVIIAVLLAQSPAYRQHVRRELHAFPMWANTLRDSILRCLNQATLDFFCDLTLVDFSNVQLNDVDSVDWNDQERPHRQSIQHIFSQQESRYREGVIRAPPTVASPEDMSESELRKRNKLTFVLLSYSVHAALGEEAPAAPLNPAMGSNAAAASPRPGMPMTSSVTHGIVRPSVQTAATPAPQFPTPYSTASRPTTTVQKDSLSAQEKQQMAFAYDRFDSSFKLVLLFAKYYARPTTKPTIYEPTPDGFVIRQGQLKNPWGPLVRKEQPKSWHVRDTKDGDFFYFAIPFDELSQAAIETVLERARRHLTYLKKLLITTPQTAKGRRWLLYDLIHHVMPGTVELLKKVHELLNDYGDENVRFPVFLFREKEMHLGERALHSGNISEIHDQVNFYFSQHPAELLGTQDDATAVARLEERLRELAAESEVSESLPLDLEGGGHGGISSDSEVE